ncbi:MAG: hypothetical protein H6835_14760 [Planctomycetes bacterium]|nr:hypothetical protein [Planctomycetota bacterium]
MPAIQVKKVVAICFLEAVKLTLEHLAAHRLELSQRGAAGPSEMTRLYADVRRLRDYLQRCASGFQEQVELEFGDADAGLTVACCRRAVDGIEHRLTDGAVTADERQWLVRKRRVLADWAVELAQKPLIELPLQRVGARSTDESRSLTTRLQEKVYGNVVERPKIVAPSAGAGTGIATGLVSFGDQLLAATPSEGEDVTGSADVSPPVPMTLLERGKVREPRLAAIVALDQSALDRAVQAGDHRIATVLLGSIMEAALLDHLIPRRAEFGLSGAPDSWNLPESLIKAMGEQAGPKDRALAFHLFGARGLLVPARQMVTPTVVTAASFDRLRDFAERALHALGFGGSRAESVQIDD